MATALTHHRTCSLCEAMCGIVVEHRDGEVLSIKPKRDDVLSRGHICPIAVALKDVHEDPDRLRRPVPATVAEKPGVADHQRLYLFRVLAGPGEPDEAAPVVDDERDPVEAECAMKVAEGLQVALEGRRALVGGVTDLDGGARSFRLEFQRRLGADWTIEAAAQAFGHARPMSPEAAFEQDDFLSVKLARHF